MTMKTENLPAFDDVFSEYSTVGVSGWDDLPHLGKLNLQELLSSLRSSEKRCTRGIKDEYDKGGMFEGANGARFAELAKGYECPVVEMGKAPKDSWLGDPEPVDVDSMSRKRGSTTFNLCGWCEHGGGGSGRYGYMITTSCSLLPDEASEEASHEDADDPEWAARVAHIADAIHGSLPFRKEARTDTPCYLHALTSEECEAVVRWRARNAQELVAHREELRAAIRHVKQLLDAATIEKPYIRSLRPYAWFDVGDAVVVHLRDFNAAMLVKDPWGKAKVIPGYRHHDGCVSYGFELPVHTGEYLNGRGGGSGASSPGVLKEWEFEYLKKAVANDPEFVRIWCAGAGKRWKSDEDTFDAEQFCRDLLDGTVARKEAVSV